LISAGTFAGGDLRNDDERFWYDAPASLFWPPRFRDGCTQHGIVIDSRKSDR
jgi:hypothetical protein